MKRFFNLQNPLHLMALVLLLAFAFASAGCAQLGLQKPESAEDTLQYARSVASGSYKTIGDLKASNAITTDQGIGYFKKVEAAEMDLNKGETLLKAGKPADARSTINLALNALNLIRDELAKKVPK